MCRRNICIEFLLLADKMLIGTALQGNVTQTNKQNNSIDKMKLICDVICENPSHVAKGETAK